MQSNNIQIKPEMTLYKKQNYFTAKCCLVAGFLFALIFAISYLIANYAFIKMSIDDQNIMIITGSVALIVAFVFAMILSFKGMRASYFLLIGTMFIYFCAITIMFSAYFSLLGSTMMFYSLAFTALAMIITGVVGFVIGDKMAYSLMKISMISIFAYLIVAIAGSFIINYTWTTNFEVWQIIITAIIGVAIICSNIYTFYGLKKTSEFSQLDTLDATTSNKLLMFQSFSLLVSIVNTFMLILRILTLVKD